MTYSSLRWVIVFVPCALAACAHELDEFPSGAAAGEELFGKGGAAGSLSTSGDPEATTPAKGGNASPGDAGQGATGGSAMGGSSAGRGGSEAKGGASNRGGEGSGGGAEAGASQGGASSGAAAGASAGGVAGSVALAGASAGGSSGSSQGGMAGAGQAGSTSSGGSKPEDGCDGVPMWEAGTYQGGDRVQNGVNLYECKPYPYSGWCGKEAYAPGSGWAWTDAWELVGPC